ncbi:winged helix-turn-helix domain-containing protein [Cedecea neteri]|uniref:winged helix-turn-helix domain-containing protein n=1 Tax=Cedecea neteri TaxID=158822 RepID=UPI002AA72D01|nr:winged helix-turn-helix domain-containing protein [Cedecea neteri]WPU21970.1 winged helix-turn-helix domain-containing protein [Cedecea neteri]
MLYVIRETIKFRSEDGVVFLDGNEDPIVTLSATMSRLLAFLLDRQGEVCSRDDILEKVWDAHGLRSSNNSLNKYITDLRKLFHRLGIEEDVITTVPRIGFIFSADIDILREKLDAGIVDTVDEKTVNISPRKSTKGFMVASSLFVLLAIIPLVFSDFIQRTDMLGSAVSDKQTFSLGTIDNCDIQMLNQASEKMTPIKKQIAADLIKRHRLICDDRSVVYFQIADPIAYGHKDRAFISLCTKSQDSKIYISCNSFYEGDYDARH